MEDCKNLIIEDITPWHGDVFDHPSYRYTCKLTGKKVIACIRCNENRCKNYEPMRECHADMDMIEKRIEDMNEKIEKEWM